MDVLRLWHSRCSLFLYFRFILFTLKERCGTDIGGNWLELSNIATGGAGALFWIRESGRYEALHHLRRSEGIDEAIVLATCNRTEFILWASDVPAAVQKLFQLDKPDLIETEQEN